MWSYSFHETREGLKKMHFSPKILLTGLMTERFLFIHLVFQNIIGGVGGYSNGKGFLAGVHVRSLGEASRQVYRSICVYVYTGGICVYVYTGHMCICIYTYMCICIYIYTRILAHIYICVCVCV